MLSIAPYQLILIVIGSLAIGGLAGFWLTLLMCLAGELSEKERTVNVGGYDLVDAGADDQRT